MSTAILELLKLSLRLYFSMARTHGATEGELDAIYQEEKDKFNENDPNTLENV